VCPIRALAAYLLAFPQIVVDEGKLFPGSDKKVDLGHVYISL